MAVVTQDGTPASPPSLGKWIKRRLELDRFFKRHRRILGFRPGKWRNADFDLMLSFFFQILSSLELSDTKVYED